MIPHLLDNRDNVCKLLAVCLAHIKHFVIAIITNRHLLVFHWLKNKKRKNLSREAFAKEGKARGLQIAKSFEPHWPQNPERYTLCPSGFHSSSRVPRAPARQHPQQASYTALRAEIPTQTTAQAKGSPEGEACPTHLRAQVNKATAGQPGRGAAQMNTAGSQDPLRENGAHPQGDVSRAQNRGVSPAGPFSEDSLPPKPGTLRRSGHKTPTQ